MGAHRRLVEQVVKGITIHCAVAARYMRIANDCSCDAVCQRHVVVP